MEQGTPDETRPLLIDQNPRKTWVHSRYTVFQRENFKRILYNAAIILYLGICVYVKFDDEQCSMMPRTFAFRFMIYVVVPTFFIRIILLLALIYKNVGYQFLTTFQFIDWVAYGSFATYGLVLLFPIDKSCFNGFSFDLLNFFLIIAAGIIQAVTTAIVLGICILCFPCLMHGLYQFLKGRWMRNNPTVVKAVYICGMCDQPVINHHEVCHCHCQGSRQFHFKCLKPYVYAGECYFCKQKAGVEHYQFNEDQEIEKANNIEI